MINLGNKISGIFNYFAKPKFKRNIFERAAKNDFSFLTEKNFQRFSDIALWNEAENNTNASNPCRTLLHLAVSAGNLDAVKTLLEKGAKLSAKDKNEETPLFFAIRQNNVEMITLLVGQGANINEIAGERSNSPLLYAICSHKKEATECLIELGADPHVKSDCQGTFGSGDIFYHINNRIVFLIGPGELLHMKPVVENALKNRAKIKGEPDFVWLLPGEDKELRKIATSHLSNQGACSYSHNTGITRSRGHAECG